MKATGWFTRFAGRAAHNTGHPAAFFIAVAVVAVWGVTGPLFKFSDTWQLVINTGTTIITFLMVFLIQNTQNRDSAAIHLKLDELIRVNKQAHNSLLDLEEVDEELLVKMRDRYGKLAEKARNESGTPIADGSIVEGPAEEGEPEGDQAQQAAARRSKVRSADRSR